MRACERDRCIFIFRKRERKTARERKTESTLQCVVVCVRSTQIEAKYCFALQCVADCCTALQGALQGVVVC